MELLPNFVHACLMGCLVFLLPGYLMLRAARLPRMWALVGAPAVSIATETVLGELLSIVRVPATPVTILGIPCLVAVLLLAALRNADELPMPHLAWWPPAMAAGVGLFVGWFFLVCVMPEFDSVFQAYDIVHHNAGVQSFAESARFTWWADYYYGTYADQLTSPYPSGGFYPDAWTVAGALIKQLTGNSAALSVNALNYVIVGLVWPFAMQGVVASALDDDRLSQALAGVMSSAFVLFPWTLLSDWPLYPNLFSFALVPAAAWPFIELLRPGRTVRERLTLLVVFVLGCTAIMFAQPNGIFTLGTFLIAYVGWRLWTVHRPVGALALDPETGTYYATAFGGARAVGGASFAPPDPAEVGLNPYSAEGRAYQRQAERRAARQKPASHRARGGIARLAERVPGPLLALAWVAGCMAVWFFVYKLPFMYGTTHFGWPTFTDVPGALVNIASIGYVNGFAERVIPFVAQPLLGVLVALGVVRTFVERRGIWLTVSYLFACVIVFGNSALYELPKRLLGGFWFGDPYRLGAMASIFAVPMAGLGLAWIGTGIARLLKLVIRSEEWPFEELSVGAGVFVALLFCVVNFDGAQLFPGTYDWFGAFAGYVENATQFYDADIPLQAEERAFLDEVADVVPEGAIVINNPFDGSLLAYSENDLRVLYRFIGGYGYLGELKHSVNVRAHLDEYATNESVREAVDYFDAEYVLKLMVDPRGILFAKSDNPWQFAGIVNITDETPGFEVVLAKGDMRLYRIVGTAAGTTGAIAEPAAGSNAAEPAAAA